MQNNDWIHDNRLSAIPTEKKEFLHEIFFELSRLSDKEKLPFIMALLSSGKLNALHFTNEELALIMSVLKENADEGELSRLQGLINMLPKN